MNALLRWIAPTRNTNGTKINGPITYNVYQFIENTGATTFFPIKTGLTATSVELTGLPNQHICFCVRAIVNGRFSSISPIVCKEM